MKEGKFDDDGLTRWQRGRKKAKELISDFKYPLAVPALVGLIYAGGIVNKHVLTREVFPLAFYDFNGDDKRDPVVAFPVFGTESARLGYIDGKHLPEGYKNGPLGPIPFRANVLNFIPFNVDNMLDGSLNSPNALDYGKYTRVTDSDGDGKENDLEIWFWSDMGHGGLIELQNIID